MNDETPPNGIPVGQHLKTPGRPKIIFGLPTRDMVHMDFALTLASTFIDLCLMTAILPANPRSCYVSCNRNDIVLAALENEADWIMWIDSDIEAPMTAVRRLLSHDKDIVGGTYIRRSAPYQTLMGQMKDRGRVMPMEGLVEMTHLPTGFMLTKVDVFRKLTPPWFRLTWKENGTPEPDLGDDYFFCDRAMKAGYQIWCDAAVTSELAHHCDIGLRPQQQQFPGAR